MSEVDICNLALSHLGDTAAVVSIKPPDSSQQAQLCARFYPIARNALLEMAAWGFATTRVALAQVNNPTVSSDEIAADATAATDGTVGAWLYAYALPSDSINPLAVLPADAASDYEAWFGPVAQDYQGDYNAPYPQGYLPVPGAPLLVPQPFAIETAADGSQIVLTNVCDATLRYTRLVTDTTKFSPLFTLALSHLLASMLAGPIIKGDAGVAAAEQQLQIFNAFKGQASASDANQRRLRLEPAPPWIRGR